MYKQIPGDGVNTNTTEDNEENTVDTGLDSNFLATNQVRKRQKIALIPVQLLHLQIHWKRSI